MTLEVGRGLERRTPSLIEEAALVDERLEAPRTEAPSIRGIDGDEVALRFVVAFHETRHSVTEQRSDRSGAGPRVGCRFSRSDCGADVVHEPGDLQLEVIRGLSHEQLCALERVCEQGDRLAVTSGRTCGKRGEELVDAQPGPPCHAGAVTRAGERTGP